ncbi:MAG: DUF502 domain-containing protein, partial [Halanaerobiales bacterium]
MLKKIRNLIITGILVLLPLIGSVYIIWLLFDIIDTVTGPVIEIIFGREITGVGTLFTFVIIFSAGL